MNFLKNVKATESCSCVTPGLFFPSSDQLVSISLLLRTNVSSVVGVKLVVYSVSILLVSCVGIK